MNIYQKLLVALISFSVLYFVGSVKYSQYQLSQNLYYGTVISKYSTTQGRHNLIRVDWDTLDTQEISLNRGNYLNASKGDRVVYGYKFSFFGPGGSAIKDFSAVGGPSVWSVVTASVLIWIGMFVLLFFAYEVNSHFWRWLGRIGSYPAKES